MNPISNELNNIKTTFNNTVGERLGAAGRSIKQGSFAPLQQSFQKQGQELKQQFGGPAGAVNLGLSFGGGDSMDVGTKLMPIEKLVAHEGTDPAVVGQYIHHINSGGSIDPLKVIPEGNQYGVEDGKHRLEALKQTGAKYAPVEVMSKVKINNYQGPQYTKGAGGRFTGSK